jgi:uncharacterized protein (DUF885 family)
MNRRNLLSAAPAALLALSPAAAPAAQAGRAASAHPFVALRDRYFLGVLRFNPVTATYLGGDGYSPTLADINGRLRDYSPQGLAREVAFYREIDLAYRRVRPETLPVQLRIDHEVMGAQLAFIRRQLEDLRHHQRAIDTYVAEPFRGVDWQLQQMTDAGSGRLGSPAEWELVVRRLQAVPAYLQAAAANLQAGIAAGVRPDWRMVERDGVAGSASNADYFRKTLFEQASAYVGDRPFGSALLPRLRAAGEGAAQAYERFAAFLQTAYAGDRTDRFAVGEADYAWRVRNNVRDTRSPAQLFAYGQEEVRRYQERMYAVAAEVARGAGLGLAFDTPEARNASVRAVMEHLAGDSPRNDQELLQWYVEAGRRAVQYGRERELFTIPADYRLDVVDTPPVLRSTIDAAYYPAPPFKKTGVGRFYLTPTGNDPAALKLNNRASVATTAIHEGFPGHDWHYKYMSQHAREISNIRWLTPGAVEDSSSMWQDSPLTEGWGLYAEELMAEPAPGRPYGFYTPAEHLYELQAQLMRAVRVVVDVGIHTGRMGFDEAVDYFNANHAFYPGARQKAAQDPTAKALTESANRAIYRYSKWPTQAITYNLGKNAILDLREAYRQARGAAYSPKAFHERLMRMGTIPVAYYRAAFLAEG